jgi:hypothetical protein
MGDRPRQGSRARVIRMLPIQPNRPFLSLSQGGVKDSERLPLLVKAHLSNHAVTAAVHFFDGAGHT